MIRAQLSFKSGKNALPPNTILVPDATKSFPVTVQWSMESDGTAVLAAPDSRAGHEWCVLDGKLKQIMTGDGGRKKKASAKTAPHAARTLMGGGAPNPKEVKLELDGSKLKNGADYTLVCRRWGVLSSLDFVAVHQPGAAPAKKARAKRKKKAAGKRAAKA